MTTLKTGRLHRSLPIDLARFAAGDEAKTVEFSLSSEEPYERWFGTEVLDHKPTSVRMARLADGAPLLRNHSTSQHIGIVEEAWLKDQKLHVRVRFGNSQVAQDAWRDVQDGILKNVSVGYIVHTMTEEKRDGKAVYRASDWEPIEASLVPIPADPTVGIGRDAEDDAHETTVIVQRAPRAEPPAKPTPVIETSKESKMDEVKNHQDAMKRLGTIADDYAAHGARDLLPEALRAGWSAEKFQEEIMKKITSKHTDQRALDIDMSEKDRKQYSLLRALNAQVTGNWQHAGFEREASNAVADKLGKAAEGFYVPTDIFKRDFLAGTAVEAGNLIATDLSTDLFTDVLRRRLVLGRAGATILTGLSSNLDIPRKSVASAIGMLTEVATALETQPNTSKVTLSPKRMSAFVQVSKQAMIQSSLAVEAMVRQDLTDGVADLFEDQNINGSGTGVNMRGIRNISGIGAVIGGTNGLAINWGHIVDLESACANVNAEPDLRAAYILNTRSRGTLKKTQKAANLPMIWDGQEQPLNDYRAFVTNFMPNNLTKGTSTGVCSSLAFSSDWSMWVMAVFGALDITVDPYSMAKNGMVEITVNFYGDCNSRLPATLAVMDDALTP